MVIGERWNNRNNWNSGELPDSETDTVPLKNITDKNGNALNLKRVNLNGEDVVVEQGVTDGETKPVANQENNKVVEPETKTATEKSALDTSNELMSMFNYVSPEEQAKRERAANAIAGIGNLGNVLNAFSNLIFTNGGAPNMQLPKAPDGNLQTFQNRILNNRMKYLSYLDAKEKEKMRNELKRQELDYKMKKDVEDRAFELKKLNGNLSLGEARIQAQKEIADKRAEEQQRHNKAQEAIGWRNADTARFNKDKIVDSALGDDGNIYTRNTKLTLNEAMQIVQSSGLNGADLDEFTTGAKEKPGYPGETIPGTGKVDWMAAAAYALQNGMVSAEELKSRGFKLGGGSSPSSGKKQSPTGAGKKKSPTA